MGVFEFVFAVVLVGTLGIASIPLYAMYRGYNQSDENIKLKQVKQEIRLEELKQENFLLENEQMRLELDKIKSDRESREKKKIESENNKRWLIEESKKEDGGD
ncbi:hypothetical protein [Corticicoccus populi]|uniref:Uncharacterized protein n=1 Tax=Corticicoccus populi TaxID=1812821 RepID=A0ABW5WY42_9STAP